MVGAKWKGIGILTVTQKELSMDVINNLPFFKDLTGNQASLFHAAYSLGLKDDNYGNHFDFVD